MLISKKSDYNVDELARNLAMLGAQAAAMPPAYLGAGIWEPCIAPRTTIGQSSNGHIGKMMDGKGLLLNGDLKDLGIRKPIPHVYERTLARRIFDALGDERAAITKYDDIVNARGSGNYNDAMWSKASTVTTATSWSSIFRTTGMPTAGTYTAIPTGAAFNNATTASLMLGTPNPGSNTAYLASVGVIAGQQINMFQFVDLLVGAGSISLTVNTSQTVSSTALTRYGATGAGVYMTFEVTTLCGATAQNITATYTNQAGTGSQSTGAQALAASAIVQRLVPVTGSPWMPLAAGDYGVRAVASVQCSAANTAGAVALNLAKPLVFMPGLVSNVFGEKDTTITIDTLVQLQTETGGSLGCLALYILPNTTSTGIMSPVVRVVWG